MKLVGANGDVETVKTGGQWYTRVMTGNQTVMFLEFSFPFDAQARRYEMMSGMR